MKKNITNLFLIFVIVLIGQTSCTNNKKFITGKNGTRYLVHYLGNDSVKAKESEIVTVNLSYRLGDSLIFFLLPRDLFLFREGSLILQILLWREFIF